MNATAARVAGICTLAALGAFATSACGRSQAPEPAAASSTASAADAPVTTSSFAPARPATETERAEFVRWFTSQPRFPLKMPTEGARVLILKFNDFQCPPCAQSHAAYMPIIKEAQREHPGQVRFVMMDYPLDSECNPYVAAGPHDSACEAAAAVRLAWEHGTADTLIEWIFANHPRLTPALVRQAALEIGGIKDFDAKYLDTLQRIQGDIEFGHQLQIRQTPTFFINGVRLEGGFAPDYIEEAIRVELQAPPR